MIDRISKHLGSAFDTAGREGRNESAEDDPWKEQAKEAFAQAGVLIATHPVAALTTAIVVGIAIGWWVKRR